MTDTTFRPYLAAPGEPAFLGCDALELIVRASTIYEDSRADGATGLDLDQIVLCPTVSFPIPNAATAQPRWAGVSPALLWNPLLWLPAHLAEPEPDEHPYFWAARVMIEVEDAGLWSRGAGFMDVLQSVGLDAASPTDLARVAAWQSGAPDETLDDIDLAPLFGEPQAAKDLSTQVQQLFMPVGLGKHAAWLAMAVEEAIESAQLGAAPVLAAAAYVALAHESPEHLRELADLHERAQDEDSYGVVLEDVLALCADIEGRYAEMSEQFDAEVLAAV